MYILQKEISFYVIQRGHNQSNNIIQIIICKYLQLNCMILYSCAPSFYLEFFFFFSIISEKSRTD